MQLDYRTQCIGILSPNVVCRQSARPEVPHVEPPALARKHETIASLCVNACPELRGDLGKCNLHLVSLPKQCSTNSVFETGLFTMQNFVEASSQQFPRPGDTQRFKRSNNPSWLNRKP